MSLLRVSGLEVSAGSRRLFSLAGFEAQAGELVGLSGPNGRGKTTLLRLLAGLARPREGSIDWSGTVLEDCSPVSVEGARRRGLSFMAATPALILDQTVDENLEFSANAHGRLPSRRDLDTVCERYALKGRGEQVVRSLSTGQKRRLVLASLDLIRPLVLLADEPTNGLDQDGRERCLQAIKRDCADGMLCLVASHDRELLGHCDRVLDIDGLASQPVRRAPLVFL